MVVMVHRLLMVVHVHWRGLLVVYVVVVVSMCISQQRVLSSMCVGRWRSIRNHEPMCRVHTVSVVFIDHCIPCTDGILVP